MPYVDVCSRCGGTGKSWAFFSKNEIADDVKCQHCAGTGKVKRVRVKLTMSQGAYLGWDDMVTSPAHRDKGCCMSCNKPLPPRKRTFCAPDCRSGYFWRIWKGAHWQKRAVAERDGPACRICGHVFESPIREGGKPYPDFHLIQLDHIIPLARGGDESPGNCQILCEPCHNRKTVREASGTDLLDLTPRPAPG